jgi:hypothetical protein
LLPSALSFSHQPRIDGRLLPHSARPPGAARARCCRVEIDQQHFRRPGVGADLVDDLLRVLRRRQGRALRCLGVAGQAQHQGIQGLAGGLGALFGACLRPARAPDKGR